MKILSICYIWELSSSKTLFPKESKLISGATIDRFGQRSGLWRHVLKFILLWVGLSLSGLAFAQDHITHRAWVQDPTGQWQWSEAIHQPVQAFEGVLSKGFGAEPIWIKLRISPTASPSSQNPADLLVLRIRPVYLDDIRVFDPLADGLIGVIGDRYSPKGHFPEGLDFMLPIARGDAPRDIWLRIQSTSTRQLSVQALEPQELQRLTQKQQLLFAVYVGVIFVFIVWGLIHWAFSRENIVGAFGLKQTAALMFALSTLGFTRAFWPAHWPAEWLDTATSVSAVLAVSTAILFHKMLIQEFSPQPWVKGVMLGLLGLLPVKLMLITFGETMLALRLNMIEVLLAPMIFLVAVLFAHGRNVKPDHARPLLARWVMVIFYTFLIALMALASLPGLGLIKGGEVPLYSVQAHGLVTAFFILLMLQYRNHLRLKEQNMIHLALHRSQLQAQQEKKVREEQSKLLAMLAHEIKTPLATMYMRLDANAPTSKAITSAIRDMDAVIERCLQTAQLDDSQLQAQMTGVDMVKVVQESVASCAHPQRVKLLLPESMSLHSDRQLLTIVLNNLIENAIKYSAIDSQITVELTRQHDTLGSTPQACLAVSNLPGNSGWPEADKIFEKYHRGPYARRLAGTGLGLYLVRNIMSVLQGQIHYLPQAQRIRFVVTLPLGPV